MKTTEFKKEVKALGYFTAHYPDNILVHDPHNSDKVSAVVNLREYGDFRVDTSVMELAKLTLEYAMTPIKYREEIPTYLVKLHDPERKNADCVLGRTPDNRVVICFKDAGDFDESNFLTEEEIKRNHGYLLHLAKKREEV